MITALTIPVLYRLFQFPFKLITPQNFLTLACEQSCIKDFLTFDARHEKTDLKVFVIVILKGWARMRMAAPILLFL